MKIVKTASGKKNKVKISRSEWTDLGKRAGWLKVANMDFIQQLEDKYKDSYHSTLWNLLDKNDPALEQYISLMKKNAGDQIYPSLGHHGLDIWSKAIERENLEALKFFVQRGGIEYIVSHLTSAIRFKSYDALRYLLNVWKPKYMEFSDSYKRENQYWILKEVKGDNRSFEIVKDFFDNVGGLSSELAQKYDPKMIKEREIEEDKRIEQRIEERHYKKAEIKNKFNYLYGIDSIN